MDQSVYLPHLPFETTFIIESVIIQTLKWAGGPCCRCPRLSFLILTYSQHTTDDPLCDTLHFQSISRGIHVAFPCCIAATSTGFILKNASPLLSPLMTHTSCRNLLTCTKERERAVVPCRVCSATCSVYTEPVLISILMLSIRLEMQLFFIYFARPLI